jgi:ribonuclease HII
MLKNKYSDELIEAGCDEAGRGCLAGPVFAASVILPPDFHHPLLNDSKQVTEGHREQLRHIIEKEAIAWAVSCSSVSVIDEINILKASFKAMHKAIDELSTRPQLLLIDGHIFPAYMGIVHQCVVKGDAKFTSIAAASILAKTHRDEYMYNIHKQYPQYNWENNKGYGTKSHLQAITTHGICEHHRKTFGPCK